MTEALVKKEHDVLFIFDLNSITSRQYLEHEPLSLAIFTELVSVFKDIGIDGYMFKYVANENLIICNSKALTIEYMDSLKDKVKAEYKPLTIEEVYTFTNPIRHIDIVNSESIFLDKYNVTSDLLFSTTVDYEGKTITIKSKSGIVKRTIPYYVANLVESCVYISDYIDKMKFNEVNKPVKYPYRELIKDLYTTDFINRTVKVNLPNEEEVNFNLAGKFVEFTSANDRDFAPPFTSNVYNNNSNIKDEVEEFLTPIPVNVDELLDETRAYEALAKIRLAKAESGQDV